MEMLVTNMSLQAMPLPPTAHYGQLLPGLVCFSARGFHFLPSSQLVIHAGGGIAVWVMLSHIWPSYFEVWKDFSVAADVIGGVGRQDAWLLSAVVVGRPSSRRSGKERERSSGVHQTEVNIVRPPNVLAILLCWLLAKEYYRSVSSNVSRQTLWRVTPTAAEG